MGLFLKIFILKTQGDGSLVFKTKHNSKTQGDGSLVFKTKHKRTVPLFLNTREPSPCVSVPLCFPLGNRFFNPFL